MKIGVVANSMPVDIAIVPRSCRRALGNVLCCLALTGCDHSPSQDILGSYFPAWMLCALGGILLTLVIRLVVVKSGIDAFVPARLLVYSALCVALTFSLWLFWFGN